MMWEPFLIFWGCSFLICGFIMICGVVVDKWKGDGTTAKDIMVGTFWALVPGANVLIAVVLFFYVLGEVMKKAATIQVVKGKE